MQQKMYSRWYRIQYLAPSTFSKLFLILLGLNGIVHTSNKIALVLYETDFKGLNSSLIENKLSLSGTRDTAVELNYQTLQKTSGTSKHILNSTLVEILKLNDFVLSFLNGKGSRLFDEVLTSSGLRHISLSPQDCHIVSRIFNFFCTLFALAVTNKPNEKLYCPCDL